MLSDLLGRMTESYTQWISYGKYPAVLLAALLVLWFMGIKKTKKLWLYGCVSLVCVLCPLTAYYLDRLQTNFYAYGELFALIPVTGIMACGMTLALRKAAEGKNRKYAGVLALLMAMGIVLSGSLSLRHVGVSPADNRYKIPQEELEVLQTVTGDEENVRLLAPDSILSYVRAYDGNIELIYGRNMNELLLNAYVYDTYDDNVWLIHEQMQGNLADVADVFPNEILAQECTHVILEKIKAQGFVCKDWTLLSETEHYLVYRVHG